MGLRFWAAVAWLVAAAHRGVAAVDAPSADGVDVFVQYGATRTASTFQFMAVYLLAHVSNGLSRPGGYRRRVHCRFLADVTAAALSDLRRAGASDADAVVVVKTHRINGVGSGALLRPRLPVPVRPARVPDAALPPFADEFPPPQVPAGPVPASRLFLSTKEGDGGAAELARVEPRPPNMTLAVTQQYAEFVDLGLATLGRYRRAFPDVTDGELRAIREYLRHWEVLRTCCGAQASKARSNQLHGLKAGRASAALDNPHCELYDLDAVEEALFNTTLWRAHFELARADFTMAKDMDVKRGICCYSEAATINGGGFRGVWRPPKGVAAYLAAHGDPRDHPVDSFERCKHRNFATAPAVPLGGAALAF